MYNCGCKGTEKSDKRKVKGEKLTFLVTRNGILFSAKMNYFGQKTAQFVSKYQGNAEILQIIFGFWLQFDKNYVFLHANSSTTETKKVD